MTYEGHYKGVRALICVHIVLYHRISFCLILSHLSYFLSYVKVKLCMMTNDGDDEGSAYNLSFVLVIHLFLYHSNDKLCMDSDGGDEGGADDLCYCIISHLLSS